MRKHRVVQFSSGHPAYSGRILYKQCDSLAQAGFEVTLVVPDDGVKTEHNRVFIHRIPKNRGRFYRFFVTDLRLLIFCLRSDADIFHFHDPDLLTVGFLLRILGKKVVYDVHEDLPKQTMDKQYIPVAVRGVIAWLLGVLEPLLANRMSGVVGATDQIARKFKSSISISVKNYPRLKDFEPLGGPPFEYRENAVAYVGTISDSRGIFEALDALALMNERVPVRMKLAGTFTSKHFRDKSELHPAWKYVDYLGWQTTEEITLLLRGVKVGLVTLHPTPAFKESLPIKMFEYMAVGTPMVASNFSEWHELVSAAGTGIEVDPLSPSAIATACMRYFTDPDLWERSSQAGVRAISGRLSWEAEAQKLVKFYAEILG